MNSPHDRSTTLGRAETNASPAFDLALTLFERRVPPSLRLRATSVVSLLVGSRPAPGVSVASELDANRLELVVRGFDPEWHGARATVMALVEHLEVDGDAIRVRLEFHPAHFEEEGAFARLVDTDVLEPADLTDLLRVARQGHDLSSSPLASTVGRLLSSAATSAPGDS